jgi:DNA (cytosine-5)-methyltransferase 1
MATHNQRSSVSPAATHPKEHFNARGVVEHPSFTLSSPASIPGIQVTVRAHQLGSGEWIAEPSWWSTSGHLPGDAQYPHRGSQAHPYRSEAVEAALNKVLKRMETQLGALFQTAPWDGHLASIRTWASQSIHEERQQDESLPLHGCTVIDLCSGGLGGFGLGLSSLGAEITLACEIDPEARKVYQENGRPARMHDDLCTLDGTNLHCDILTLGLLCQAFSKAGKHHGFADPALANVYTHSLRLLREIDAKAVIVECAPELLTQDSGTDAQQLRDELMRAGFRVQHRTLDASGFGVPQCRERSFVVAIRNEIPSDNLIGYLFPEEQAPTTCVADILQPGIPASLRAGDFSLDRPEPSTPSPHRERIGFARSAKTKKLMKSQGYRLMSTKGLAVTLTASGGGRGAGTGIYYIDGGARKLEPREAARLQGLPEWAAVHPTRSHAIKHAGNAVAVPVARALGHQLAGLLGHRP